MKSASIRFVLASVLALSAIAACSDEEEKREQPNPCDPVAQNCIDGAVCEIVTGAEPKCFKALSVRGKVFDTTTNLPISGAHVVARDANDAVVSNIAVTNKDGEYSLPVPVTRNPDGTWTGTTLYSLRADAQGYLTFPKPPRVAIPMDVSKATGDPPALTREQNPATDIGLVPIENKDTVGIVSGKVIADSPGGTLVVAGSPGSSASADRKGAFTVFNVPAGTGITVRGYLKGVNLETKQVDVVAGQRLEGVELKSLGEATTAVSGKIEIVNPGEGTNTSVLLAVQETFVENAARGEVPPGLRVGDVSGDFSIPNVPDGNYVVLAAFENDFLVRDPDTSIAGTELVKITVPQDAVIATSFKVTGALTVIQPDAEAEVTGPPTFEWKDDSSEKRYSLVVFDALGNQVWEKVDVPAVSGGGNATQLYEGPALTPGMIYQFKATSWSDVAPNGTPLSTTEDLKGVFIFRE